MSDLVQQQHEFLRDVALLILRAVSFGYTITGGELWRTEDQEKLYIQQGKAAPGSETSSNHLRRLAIDFNFFKNGQPVYLVTELGSYWEGLNPYNRWGGNFTSFKDYAHFERNSP